MYDYTYRLRKGKVMISLSNGQNCCISLCEKKCSIQLSFVFLPGSRHLAEVRRELLQYFQSSLELVMGDFMRSSTKPVAYIPCCFCSQLHIELQLLLTEESQYCNVAKKSIPDIYYQDLLKDLGLFYIALTTKHI